MGGCLVLVVVCLGVACFLNMALRSVARWVRCVSLCGVCFVAFFVSLHLWCVPACLPMCPDVFLRRLRGIALVRCANADCGTNCFSSRLLVLPLLPPRRWRQDVAHPGDGLFCIGGRSFCISNAVLRHVACLMCSSRHLSCGKTPRNPRSVLWCDLPLRLALPKWLGWCGNAFPPTRW